MAIKIYTKEYAGLVRNVFEAKSHFLRTFGGSLQVADGVENKDTFMLLKTSPTDVVIQDYDTSANTAFGTGTGGTSRFGPRKEIISVDTSVPYDETLAIHEGVDDFTVNDNADRIIEERAALHAEAWVEYLNSYLGEFLSDSASATIEGDLDADGVVEAFTQAHKTFVNNKVSKDLARVAYVTADVYSILLKAGLISGGKGSAVNIDEGTLPKHQGFILEELADEYFQTGEQIIFAADDVAIAGIGIQMYRLIDAEDFAGVAIQGAGKVAKYIPTKNKQAILKASLTVAP